MDNLTKIGRFASARSLRTCNFDQVDVPGTYIERRWGTLFRLPKDVLPSDRDRSSKRVAREWWPVTRLTRNPNIPLSTARKLAMHLGLRFNF
jgi:hypothetical protein